MDKEMVDLVDSWSNSGLPFGPHEGRPDGFKRQISFHQIINVIQGWSLVGVLVHFSTFRPKVLPECQNLNLSVFYVLVCWSLSPLGPDLRASVLLPLVLIVLEVRISNSGVFQDDGVLPADRDQNQLSQRAPYLQPGHVHHHHHPLERLPLLLLLQGHRWVQVDLPSLRTHKTWTLETLRVVMPQCVLSPQVLVLTGSCTLTRQTQSSVVW